MAAKLIPPFARYHVSILTHESTFLPFEETMTNLLTQFFVSNMMKLRTSILVEGLRVVHQSEDKETPDLKTKRQRTIDRFKMPKDTLVLVDHKNVEGEDGYNNKVSHQQHYLKEDVASTV
jgi:hypothetical protein